MTNKTITQVLDEIDDCAEGRSLTPMRSELKGWHDAITTHLAQTAERGEAVAFCRVEDVDDNDSHLRQCGVKRGDKLYTAPSPTIDIAAVREVIEKLRNASALLEGECNDLAHDLIRAIGAKP